MISWGKPHIFTNEVLTKCILASQSVESREIEIESVALKNNFILKNSLLWVTGATSEIKTELESLMSCVKVFWK